MLPTFAIPLQLVCQLINPGNLGVGNIVVEPKQATAALNGYTIFPSLGVAYKYYNHSRSWNLARKDCAADGANLAVVDSFEKINSIIGLKKSNYGMFVGIHRLYDDIEWISVKNFSAPAMIPWAPAEGAGELKPNEKCAALWADGRGLSPVLCSENYRFVCEIEMQVLQTSAETSILNRIFSTDRR